VVVLDRRHVIRLDAIPDANPRHLVALTAIVLVPDDHQQRVLLSKGCGVEDCWDVIRKPRIAGRNRTVVHVIAQVGRDEDVVGQA
jgi:hypothetical protein